MTDRERVIKGLECCCSPTICKNKCPYTSLYEPRNGYGYCIEGLLPDALALLKEQEPKTPIHIYEKYPQHDWETDEDGNIDEWAMSYDFHNGPVCKRCYHSFCIHCEPNGFDDGPCVIDEYKCPKCECILQKGTKFCSECGQAIKWD